MIINSHVHISIFEGNAKNLEESFELLKKDMFDNNIDASIVIPDNMENSPDVADLETAKKFIKGDNRFYLLGSPQIILRGSSETGKYEELIKNKVIRGIKFFPGHDPYYPTDERCLPYYDMCEKNNVPIVIHTGENSGDSECAKWNDPKYIVEIAKKYSDLKIIIAHFFWPKMDYCYAITRDVKNIYFDLSAVADDEVVEMTGGIEKIKNILKKTINDRSDKVIFGTDWPMCDTKKHLELMTSMESGKNIEDKIFYKNAIEIYNLPL